MPHVHCASPLAHWTILQRRPLRYDHFSRLRKVAELLNLSRAATARVEWMIWYETHGRNARATARYFRIAPKTFYKWHALFAEDNLRTLEDRSRAPVKRRSRTITRVQEERVVALKQAHLRWGKAKIAVVYQTLYGEPMTAWRVQRVITDYRLYWHPVKQARTNRRRARAVHKQRITELTTQPQTGFLLCLDTIVLYWCGVKRYLFTAVDKFSKLAFARMYPTKSARSSAEFLARLQYLLDGKIENVGHDNGSEFQGEFAALCRKLGIRQYHSRVRTPKDNATNERFNRTLREEFIQLGNLTDDVALFNQRLLPWLEEYNYRRPHQTLGYLTPMSFIQQHRPLLPMSSSTTRP